MIGRQENIEFCRHAMAAYAELRVSPGSTSLPEYVACRMPCSVLMAYRWINAVEWEDAYRMRTIHG
jgi:hypothetical protein